MGNPQLCKAEDFYVLMCQVGFSTLNIAPKTPKNHRSFETFFIVESRTGQESELWLITGYLTPRFYEGSFEYERSLTMAQGVKP